MRHREHQAEWRTQKYSEAGTAAASAAAAQQQQQQQHPHHSSNNNNDCNGEGVQHASYAQRAEASVAFSPFHPFQSAALELAPCCVLIFGSALGLHIKTISFQCSALRVIEPKDEQGVTY